MAKHLRHILIFLGLIIWGACEKTLPEPIRIENSTAPKFYLEAREQLESDRTQIQFIIESINEYCSNKTLISDFKESPLEFFIYRILSSDTCTGSNTQTLSTSFNIPTPINTSTPFNITLGQSFKYSGMITYDSAQIIIEMEPQSEFIIRGPNKVVEPNTYWMRIFYDKAPEYDRVNSFLDSFNKYSIPQANIDPGSYSYFSVENGRAHIYADNAKVYKLNPDAERYDTIDIVSKAKSTEALLRIQDLMKQLSNNGQDNIYILFGSSRSNPKIF